MSGNVERLPNDDNEIVLDGRVGGQLDPENAKDDQTENEEQDEDADELESSETDNCKLPIDDEEVETLILEAYKKNNDLKKKRTDINSANTSLSDSLAAKYINKKAWKAAMKCMEMNDDELRQFDLTMKIVRRVLGRPVQPDLFEDQ